METRLMTSEMNPNLPTECVGRPLVDSGSLTSLRRVSRVLTLQPPAVVPESSVQKLLCFMRRLRKADMYSGGFPLTRIIPSDLQLTSAESPLEKQHQFLPSR